MNIWHSIPEDRISPEKFTAFIEIPKGGHVKYELDKDTGMLIADRVMSTSTQYPWSYGFIPRTLAPDHDPLDVLVICIEPLVSNSLVECRPIGIMRMKDGGEQDDKVIAVFPKDPMFGNIREFTELPKHIFDEITHFFSVYKQLENKTTITEGVECSAAAMKTIADCMKAYSEEFKE